MTLEDILYFIIPIFIGIIIGIPFALFFLWRKFRKIKKDIPINLQVEDKVPKPLKVEKEVKETWPKKKKPLKKKIKKKKKRSKK